MPSQARSSFDQNCADIDRLVEIHEDITGDSAGRKYGVEVLNKAAVVQLTAIWEAYCEDIAAEALSFIVQNTPEASRLPLGLRKQVANELKLDPHELAVWRLAGDGWRRVLEMRLTVYTAQRNRSLNTPKTEQIDSLFEKTLGIQNISNNWYWRGMSKTQAQSKLDGYIDLRGAIAHRGRANLSVTKFKVNDYYGHIKRLVGKVGDRVEKTANDTTGQSIW